MTESDIEFNMLDYVAATLKPRFDERDDRLEIWIDVPCRDTGTARQLKARLGLPGSVRGTMLRIRTPNLGRLLMKVGVAIDVVSEASKLDKLMQRVNPCPEDLKVRRRQQMGTFAEAFGAWSNRLLKRRGSS